MIGQCRNCHHVVGIVHLNNKLCHTCFETGSEVDRNTKNSHKVGNFLRKLLPTKLICLVVPAILMMSLINSIVPSGC